MIDGIMSVWDAAPLLPIIEEAGGVFTDWRGARTPFAACVIATNRALATPVRELLAGDATPDLSHVSALERADA
jgi:fructose-1,6-bisphosphatase/inositol monophosphatase family enzyme